MNILVAGRGHIAGCLVRYIEASGNQCHTCSMNIEDITPKYIDEIGASVVVNTAGKTDLAWCENNPHEAFHSNVIAPVKLSRAVREAGRLFIHIGSGCVWDGPYNDGKPFIVSDPVTPACYYSWTKASCDAILLSESYSDVHILRPRQVYSTSSSTRNTLVKLINYPTLLDTPNSMTSVKAIADTIVYLADNNGPNLVNVYNPGVSSPFRVGELLHEAGLRGRPERLTKDQLDGFHKPKRVDTVLYDPWLEKCVKPQPIEESLVETISEFARGNNN